MTLEFFPKDTVILSAGQPTSDALYIVHKGAVKLALRSQVGKQLMIDMRSEGEVFGLLSVMGKDPARFDVTAVEDTLCYSVPGEQVQKLISSHPDVANYLLRKSFARYMDRSLEALRTQTGLLGDTEKALYSLTARDVPGTPPILCGPQTTIREAAQLLARLKATCLFVTNAEGIAQGIVTDRDFALKVVAGNVSFENSVTKIMSSPVVSVEASDRLFHALLAMVSRNIHHLLVTQQGSPAGVITAHDLMILQGKSPLNLVRHLEDQKTVQDLAAAQNHIAGLFPLLLREGARASHVTRVVAEVNDRVTSKILQFTEDRVGPPPVPYCWVAMGSEGRREQTFKTDQDNALIYADVENNSRVRDYFTRLAAAAQEGLADCGYPPCPGNFMASNPQWRQPVSVFLSYFHTWISEAERRGTEDALLFLDMRPVAGDFSLFEKIAAEKRTLLSDARAFKSMLGLVSTEHRPPLGFFRNFVLERTGEHRNQLDLKTHGTVPIVNAVRLFALDAGVEHTNTTDRLAALSNPPEDDPMLYRDLAEAFEFLMLLRIESEMRQVREREPLNNYLAPESLTHLQRSLLKEAFRTIARAQSVVEQKYRTAIWAQLGR